MDFFIDVMIAGASILAFIWIAFLCISMVTRSSGKANQENTLKEEHLLNAFEKKLKRYSAFYVVIGLIVMTVIWVQN